MQSKGAGPVNRVELESQVLCAALRQSSHNKDRVGAFTSVRELSHLFPDLLPPPEKHDEVANSNKANFYNVLGVKPQSSANSVIAGYLRTVRNFLRTQKVAEARVEYNRILNAGFILRKPRLRLSHDIVVARRWLHEESRLAQMAVQEVTQDRMEAIKTMREAVSPSVEAHRAEPVAEMPKSLEAAPVAVPAPAATSVPPMPPLPSLTSAPNTVPELAPPHSVPAPPVVPAAANREAPNAVPPVPPMPALSQAGADGFASSVPPPPMPPLAVASAQSSVVPPVPAAVSEIWAKQQNAARAVEPPAVATVPPMPPLPSMNVNSDLAVKESPGSVMTEALPAYEPPAVYTPPPNVFGDDDDVVAAAESTEADRQYTDALETTPDILASTPEVLMTTADSLSSDSPASDTGFASTAGAGTPELASDTAPMFDEPAPVFEPDPYAAGPGAHLSAEADATPAHDFADMPSAESTGAVTGLRNDAEFFAAFGAGITEPTSDVAAAEHESVLASFEPPTGSPVLEPSADAGNSAPQSEALAAPSHTETDDDLIEVAPGVFVPASALAEEAKAMETSPEVVPSVVNEAVAAAHAQAMQAAARAAAAKAAAEAAAAQAAAAEAAAQAAAAEAAAKLAAQQAAAQHAAAQHAAAQQAAAQQVAAQAAADQYSSPTVRPAPAYAAASASSDAASGSGSNGSNELDFPPAAVRAQQMPPAEPPSQRGSGRIGNEAAFVFDESALSPPPQAQNKKIPMLIQLLEAAQFITPVEVQAILAQMAFAPNVPVEKLILNAGYVLDSELASVKLGESLLQSGKINMAQFQVAIYDERTSGLRMAESLQVRGWLSVEVRNAIDEFHKKRS